MRSHISRCGQDYAPIFWTRVEKTPTCWLWTGAKHGDGYGLLIVNKKHHRAHRYAWEVTHGAPAPKGMSVMHTCDKPACVNPAHLRLGTHKENMDDMAAKKRHTYGERNGHAVLTEPQVIELRKRFKRISARRTNLPELEKDFPGVDINTLRNAATGKTWKYLP